MQLIKGHLVLKKSPAELGLIIDKGHFRNRLRFGGYQDMMMMRQSITRKMLL